MGDGSIASVDITGFDFSWHHYDFEAMGCIKAEGYEALAKTIPEDSQRLKLQALGVRALYAAVGTHVLVAGKELYALGGEDDDRQNYVASGRYPTATDQSVMQQTLMAQCGLVAYNTGDDANATGKKRLVDNMSTPLARMGKPLKGLGISKTELKYTSHAFDLDTRHWCYDNVSKLVSGVVLGVRPSVEQVTAWRYVMRNNSAADRWKLEEAIKFALHKEGGSDVDPLGAYID